MFSDCIMFDSCINFLCFDLVWFGLVCLFVCLFVFFLAVVHIGSLTLSKKFERVFLFVCLFVCLFFVFSFFGNVPYISF